MITSRIHGYIDYLTVFIFALAPLLLPLSQAGIILAYILAGIHLLITVLTAFPGGWIRKISFSSHGYVELLAGLFLVIAPWLAGDFFFHAGKLFFSVMGFIILTVWFLTSYVSPLGE